MVRPHTSKAIGLQFKPHAERVVFSFAHPTAHLVHLAADTQQVLHMVTHLMRDHVGLCKVARCAQALGQGFIKRQVDINFLVSRAIKRPHRRLATAAATGAGLTSEQHQTWFFVSCTTFGENVFPNVFGISQNCGHEFTHAVACGRAFRRILSGILLLLDLCWRAATAQHIEYRDRADAKHPAAQ